MEKRSRPAAATRARRRPTSRAIYRRVWAEAPLEAWGDRAAERLEQIAAALPAAEAAVVRARTAGEWVSRGMVLFDRNRNVESEAAFASALAAPGLDADLECRARFHRAQSVWKQRQRPRAAPLFDEAEAACATRGEPRSARQGAVPGGALLRDRRANRDAAMAHYARVEAEHADHSYADDARLRIGGAGDRRRRRGRGRQAAGGGPDALPEGRPAERGAVAAGVRGVARAARDDEALRWLDENLRLVPHEEVWYAEGRAQYWKGRVFEKQGQARRGARLVRARRARVPAVGLRAAVAEAPARRVDSDARRRRWSRRCARGCTTSRPGRSRRARCTATRASCAPSSWRAWARAATRAASWRELGLATSAEKHSTAARPAARKRISSGSPRRCSIAAASGARRTRCPRYGDHELQARVPEGAGRGEVEARLPARVPGAGREEHARPTSCPRRCSSRSCARRARSRRASNRSRTPSG